MVIIDNFKLKMRLPLASQCRERTLARGLVLFLLLLGWLSVADAATYYDKTFTESTTVTFTQVSGSTRFTVTGDNTEYDAIGLIYLNTAGITVNFKFNSGTYMLHDRFVIRQGRLNITLNNETRNVTLKRQSGNKNYLFLVDNRTTTSYNDTRLYIKGADGHRIKIDGNATWSMSGSNSAGWEATFTSGVKSDWAMIYMRAGRADISFVDFQNNWCADEQGTGGFFRVTTVVDSDVPSKCENFVLLDDCSFKKGYAEKHGTVLFAGGRLVNDKKSYVRLRRCLVQNCFCNANDPDPVSGANSGGGIFRTGGNGTTDLEIINSVLKNNRCKRTGTILWNSGLGTLTLTNDTIMNNWSGGNGGGMSIYSVASITGCKILNNYAVNNGGGVYYKTYTNSDDALPNFAPNNGSLELDAQTEIKGNYAGNNGGGIYFSVGPINVCSTYYGPQYTVFKNKQGSQYEVHAVVNGAKVMNNTAGERGGGIFINRTTDIYKSDLKINYGTFENNNATGNGGGFYVTSSLNGTVYGTCPFALTNLNVTLGSTSGTLQVVNNSAKNGGGGYITGTKHVTTINSGTIGTQAKPNRATDGNGGGLCINGGTVNINGGNFQYNTATNNGGGFYVSISNDSDIATIKGGATIINNSATNGGGAYINKGQLKVQNSATTINTNTAVTSGGGIYMANGTVLFNDATMHANTAEYGGGFYLGNGAIIIDGATVSDNTSTTGHGGAFDITNGNLTVSNTSITGNSSSNGNGGGAYVGNGDIVFNAGTTVTNNTAINGGGLYVGGGSITYNNGDISHNTATGNGGGIYANADVEFNGGTVSENTAQSGGGLYANAGTVDFSSGMFSQNGASANGGGIYLNAGATLNLTNEATITQNHVPAGGAGGGVYLGGTLNVGKNADDPVGTHSLMAHDNYAGTPSDYVLNNIFLPNETKYITLLSDISGVNPGTGVYYTRLGFSVTRGFCPVVYTDISGGNASHEAWLASLMGSSTTLTGAIFDDANKYPALHMPEDHGPILAKYIWLWGCWTTEVTSNPGPDHFTVDNEGTDAALVHIKSNRGLAWFTSYVNGLNGCDQHHNVDAVLEADVDMSEFLWVPIGAVSAATVDPTTHNTVFTDGGHYGGEFDGQGHTIEGLQCFYLNAIPKIGLFGYLNNGTVKNTFINDYWFMSTYIDETYHIGGIAGLAQGDACISNSEAHGRIETEVCKSGTSMGGLVGLMEDNAEIHSSIAIPEMSGNAAYVGGIAGKTNTGNALRNSFANLKLGSTASATGGIVGTNAGTVENCYVRLQHATAPTNFYWFAAVNNGTVGCCYARNDAASDHYTTVTAATGSGTYGLTQLPYLYKHRDTQVDANNDYVPTGTDADKQLMIVLNRWVDTINSKQSAINYTKWGRPWQESDAQKPLNDDYPILKMPMGEAVAAEAGDPYLYYGTVDNLLTQYNAAGDAIWMYRNSESVTGDNSISAAKLYIAEDVALLNANALKAYVGITLDNSAGADGVNPTYFPGVTDVTDWHMIATPLSDAPIGINYDNGTYDFDYGHPSGMPYYLFYPKDDAKHGYFPSHRFGKDYPGSAATIEEGNYYTEWDFYSYYEPEYHWINFKRNSASHHHMEAEDHSSIAYDNETRLVPGKGYFAATREETFLQCQGHLNADEVTYDLTQTSGVPRHGYNLIGNPYQAYLDFDAFADANSGDNKIWAAASNASYTILDEDELERSINVETIMGQKPVFYRTYSYGCSDNPDVSAGGFIHPHQGFFVRLEGDKASAQAQFAPDQRNATDTVGSKFRGAEHIDYPLVNLFAIEGNGAADVVTVELGRPDEGGAALMQGLRVGNGKIWCHYNDKDYAIAYTQPGITEVGIRFETVEDTEYTMRWSTRNGDFSYLHLIDNKTGADVDCLATDEYKFSASMSDYKSRFRLVFGYTGIEEESEAEANENFAFMMNDALVVTGEGVLQVFDMTGRMVASQELHGVQTTVSLPNAANGVYVLRLTEGKQSRVQKMVISK